MDSQIHAKMKPLKHSALSQRMLLYLKAAEQTHDAIPYMYPRSIMPAPLPCFDPPHHNAKTLAQTTLLQINIEAKSGPCSGYYPLYRALYELTMFIWGRVCKA